MSRRLKLCPISDFKVSVIFNQFLTSLSDFLKVNAVTMDY